MSLAKAKNGNLITIRSKEHQEVGELMAQSEEQQEVKIPGAHQRKTISNRKAKDGAMIYLLNRINNRKAKDGAMIYLLNRINNRKAKDGAMIKAIKLGIRVFFQSSSKHLPNNSFQI